MQQGWDDDHLAAIVLDIIDQAFFMRRYNIPVAAPSASDAESLRNKQCHG
jgi:hypothetical protein